MTEAMGGWGRPELLVGLWLLVPVILLAVWALRSRMRALARLAMGGLQVAPTARRIHRLRLLLTVAGLGLALVALGQPRWGYHWQELHQEGRAIVVVLDVSLSMDAEDVSPSRIERARRELQDLADELRGDKIGLVQVAGGAHARMPLTLDTDAFRQVVRSSSTSSLRAQGSDLGRAIEVAADLLSAVPAGDRAILIVSDGEDHAGKAVEAAQAAAEQDIHIYTLGVGTEDGAPIPLADGGFKKDHAGRVVLTRLDRDLLQQLAAVGSGAYADSVAGTSDIRAIYGDEILAGLEAADLGVRREKVWKERYQWPLGLGLLLLLLAQGLRPRRRRAQKHGSPAGRDAARAAALLLALAGTALPSTASAQDPPAQDAPQADAPPAQLDPLQRMLSDHSAHPGDLQLAEELGQALYEAGRYDEATEILDGVAQRSTDDTQRQRARSNAGLAAYQAGRLTEAVQDWQQVLQENPEHEAASSNAQAVLEEIARRRQQQQDQQQQQQQQQDQQQGDTGQQDQQQQGQGGDTGAPQDQQQQGDTGQQEQQGQQQQGEQQQSQQGEQQQGEQQQGEQQQGEQQQGEQQQGEQQQPQQGEQQQPPPDSDGTMEAQPQDAEPEQGEEQEGQLQAQARDAQDTGTSEEAEPEVHRPGTMSEQEADRLLEGVEEGTPRVTVDPGSRGDKDW